MKSPRALYREEKEKARARNVSHAELMAEAKKEFEALLAAGQAARKSGRPKKVPAPPPDDDLVPSTPKVTPAPKATKAEEHAAPPQKAPRKRAAKKPPASKQPAAKSSSGRKSTGGNTTAGKSTSRSRPASRSTASEGAKGKSTARRTARKAPAKKR